MHPKIQVDQYQRAISTSTKNDLLIQKRLRAFKFFFEGKDGHSYTPEECYRMSLQILD